MAAGNVTVLNIAKPKLANGKMNLSSDTFKVALTTSSQSITAAFSGTSGDARYSDLADEVSSSGTGYTTGGNALSSVTWSGTGGTVTFDAADLTFTAITATFKYLVIYDSTAANKDILAFVDLDTSGGSITVSGTDYDIVWNASGLFTLA